MSYKKVRKLGNFSKLGSELCHPLPRYANPIQGGFFFKPERVGGPYGLLDFSINIIPVLDPDMSAGCRDRQWCVNHHTDQRQYT